MKPFTMLMFLIAWLPIERGFQVFCRADAKKIEGAPSDLPASKGRGALSAAYTIAKLGREKKQPDLLLAAARVIGTTRVAKPEPNGDQVGIEDELRADAMALVAEANAIGGTSAEPIALLAAAVEKEIKEVKRGATDLGPRVYVGTFDRAPETNQYVAALRGGNLATIALYKLGLKGDIELYVTDPDGKEIKDPRIRCEEDFFLTFTPPKTAKYKIAVKCWGLSGEKSIRYRLIIDQR
ncbi:MAG: hypothetical protein K8T89_05145 [Planctomycetes bacterium]|nr:hypothetical protein [Planctomycetota bacterium]